MYRTIATYTRPNLDTEFFTLNNNLNDMPGVEILGPAKQYTRMAYKDTGKLISTEVTVSPNGLVQTVTMNWLNAQCRSDWLNDPILADAHDYKRVMREINNIVFVQVFEGDV